jgi:hypothetical protein
MFLPLGDLEEIVSKHGIPDRTHEVYRFAISTNY